MFDSIFPELAELAKADDTMVVASITGWAAIEAAASARRLAAIAELVRRRTDGAAHEQWSCDDWDATAAEVASALHLSHGKASGQMYLGTALRDRLPRVAEAFAEGQLSAQVVAAIAWHTQLVTDTETMALIDKSLARDAVRYGPLSAKKTTQAINAIIDRYDPGALRQTRALARGRDVGVDTDNTRNGITPLWGYLYATDAAALDRRLMAMAHAICDDDPRTIAQRRADALGVLAAGGDRLVCGCGDPDCPAATAPATSGILVHLVAHADALDTPVDPDTNGEWRGPAPEPTHCEPAPPEAETPKPETAPAVPPAPTAAVRPPAVAAPPALLLGGTVMPAPLLAELIRNGATVRPLHLPGPDCSPESGYRPSAALADFIRCRDLTCRFPGCDAPAEFCDIDHTIPRGDGGPTHPSKVMCC